MRSLLQESRALTLKIRKLSVLESVFAAKLTRNAKGAVARAHQIAYRFMSSVGYPDRCQFVRSVCLDLLRMSN